MIFDLTTEHKRLLLLLNCYRLQYALSSILADTEKHSELLEEIQTHCEDNSSKLSCEEYQTMISKLKSIQEEHGLQIIGENEGKIISTLGLKADGWYKCPNGHYYNFNNTIDEYDGKCPECCLALDQNSSQAQATEDSNDISMTEDSDGNSSTSSDNCIIIV